MKKENIDKLKISFPELYKKCKRFECEDGWFQLLWELSQKVSQEIKFLEAKEARLEALPYCIGLQEKYGELVYDIWGIWGNDKIDKLVVDAETASLNVCELCGDPGKANWIDNPDVEWMMVRCSGHDGLTNDKWHRRQIAVKELMERVKKYGNIERHSPAGITEADLEKNLPPYLQHDLDALVEGEKNNSTLLDCLWSEVYGSINSAEVDLLITIEQAAYLRKKYLYGDE